jgi:uncharacterized protein (DUF488 family)
MPAGRIWTIGHSTRTFDAFLALLRANQITRLGDIRTIPQSRRHPHFSRAALDAHLKQEGIEYRHFPELGGLRKPRPDSPNGAWKNQAFRGYADHMLTREFSNAVDELLEYGDSQRAAVMCAEAVWWRCHRMLLSDGLVARGVEVQHILSDAKTQPHRLTPFAKVGPDGEISYPDERPIIRETKGHSRES